MSEVAGCAMAGARTITTTSGPGTLRAMENFPQWSGTRIPCQLILMARGINSPLTIQPDNLEVSLYARNWLSDLVCRKCSRTI